MTLKTLATGASGAGEGMGHTIDLDRLPESPTVLDVGCRGFEFVREMLEIRPTAEIIALDPDPLIQDPNIDSCHFFPLALVGDDRETSGYISFGDGVGNFLAPTNASTKTVVQPDNGWNITDHLVRLVDCYNVRKLMLRTGILHWDVVKLDCEGSEFQILENWPGPIATQISVEFHDFTGPREESVRRGYYENVLWPHLGQWYEIVQHEWMEINKVPSTLGHWDSLLVLR